MKMSDFPPSMQSFLSVIKRNKKAEISKSLDNNTYVNESTQIHTNIYG